MTSLEIMQTVARWHGVPWRAFASSQVRTRETVLCRWEAFWLVRNVLALSYPNIGRKCGYDHSSVIHGVKGWQSLIDAGRAVDHSDDILAGRVPETCVIWKPQPTTLQRREYDNRSGARPHV